jgi:predicted GIY-YIG superfamily endonuclease
VTEATGIRRVILEDGPTTLYRLRDRKGRLLYVGISTGIGRRLLEHEGLKEWWRLVESATFEHFERRSIAITAEALVITNERPLYNILARAGIGAPLPPTRMELLRLRAARGREAARRRGALGTMAIALGLLTAVGSAVCVVGFAVAEWSRPVYLLEDAPGAAVLAIGMSLLLWQEYRRPRRRRLEP